MTSRKPPASAAGLTIVAVTAAATIVLTAPPAAATVLGEFASSANSSDPHIINCVSPVGGPTRGYCLYTSQDMGQDYAYKNANHYPMRDTLVYWSPNGYSGWEGPWTVFAESQIDWVPRRTGTGTGTGDRDHDSCVTTTHARGGHRPKSPDTHGNCGAYHLWAPSVLKESDNRYYLFVPDVSSTAHVGNANIHNSSKIAVATSANPLASRFIYKPGYITDQNGSVPGYMSDPDVVKNGAERILVWANGDAGNCGGFGRAKLDPATMMTMLNGTIGELVINGINHSQSGLGHCNSTTLRPYLEGASIYKRSMFQGQPWTLVFAAKPGKSNPDGTGNDVIPKECNADNSSSDQPHTANSVIAWASAASPMGPFTYRGVIMCGSQHEWTNQASVAITANSRFMIVYHEAANGNKERKLQAQCLYVHPASGKIAAVYRQHPDSANGFKSCVTNTEDPRYVALYLRDPQQPAKAPLISTNPSVTGTDAGQTIAKRYAVGPWERYRFEETSTGSGVWVVRSLANNKLLCAKDKDTPVRASCTSTSDLAAQFAREPIPNGYGDFRLKSKQTNLWLGIASNGRPFISSTSTGEAAVVTALSYEAPAHWNNSMSDN